MLFWSESLVRLSFGVLYTVASLVIFLSIPGTITGFFKGIVGSMILSKRWKCAKGFDSCFKVDQVGSTSVHPIDLCKGKTISLREKRECEAVKCNNTETEDFWDGNWREEDREKWTGDKRPRKLASWTRRFTSMEGLECKSRMFRERHFLSVLEKAKWHQDHVDSTILWPSQAQRNEQNTK